MAPIPIIGDLPPDPPAIIRPGDADFVTPEEAAVMALLRKKKGGTPLAIAASSSNPVGAQAWNTTNNFSIDFGAAASDRIALVCIVGGAHSGGGSAFNITGCTIGGETGVQLGDATVVTGTSFHGSVHFYAALLTTGTGTHTVTPTSDAAGGAHDIQAVNGWRITDMGLVVSDAKLVYASEQYISASPNVSDHGNRSIDTDTQLGGALIFGNGSQSVGGPESNSVVGTDVQHNQHRNYSGAVTATDLSTAEGTPTSVSLDPVGAENKGRAMGTLSLFATSQ